jgi:CRP-like cAMP-binding protein
VHTREIIPLLRQIALFRDLESSILEAIVPHLGETVFARGDIVFHEGDPGECVHVLLTGTVSVYVQRGAHTITYAVLPAGTCFGEMALIEDVPRSANVRAEDACRCLTLDKQTFLALLQGQPHMALAIIRQLCQRLRHTNAQVQDYVAQLQALSPPPT